MDSNDILQNVNKVVDIVNHAVETKDYSSMSSQIGNLIGAPKAQDLFNDVKNKYAGNKYHAGHVSGSKAGTGSASFGGNPGTTAYQNRENGQNGQAGSSYNYTYSQPKPKTAAQTPFAPRVESPYYKTPKTLSGKLMLGGGIAGFIIMLIPTAVLFGTYLLTKQNPLVGAFAFVPAIFAVGFAVLAIAGGVTGGQARRFGKYVAAMGSRLYADVKTLASAVGYSEKKTVKDLKKMISLGWFKQGHLDRSGKTFMATDELYRQSENAAVNSEAEKKLKDQKSKEDAALSPEVRSILDRGNAYIAKIQADNDAIPDAGVSEKLDRMKNIVSKIFAQVKVQPNLAGKLNMFMDYYLPTTGKLMDAYKEMDSQPIQGENIASAKKEIEDSLDTINDAFESLLDSFFKEKAMDVSTDISVMKTMMKQQGLTPDDLEAMKMKQAQSQMEHGPTLEQLQNEIDKHKPEYASAETGTKDTVKK